MSNYSGLRNKNPNGVFHHTIGCAAKRQVETMSKMAPTRRATTSFGTGPVGFEQRNSSFSVTSTSPAAPLHYSSHEKYQEQQQAQPQTLILLVPLSYNPDADGVRTPVEPWKLSLTEREVRLFFDGYSTFQIRGWYRDPETHEEYWDLLLRYEIDLAIFPSSKNLLSAWKARLQRRFRQQAIYMKLSPKGDWL